MNVDEKQPLTSTDEKARKALKDLSSSLGASDDVENPYLLHRGGGGGGGGGGGQGARPHALLAHMRRSWWLWSTAAFAVCLIGGLLVFRNSLYDSGAHGLPFLAVKDNAEEACTLACSGVPHNESAPAGTAAARGQDTYDACYAKCVLQQTREVAEERQAFKRTEEEYAREEDDGEHMQNQVKAHEEDGGSDDADDEEDPALADLKAVQEQEKLEKAAKKAAKKAKKKGKKAARGDDDEEGW